MQRKIGVLGIILALAGAGFLALFYGQEVDTVINADAKIIQQILARDVNAVLSKIPLEDIEVSLPLDGKGARVLVRVRPGEAEKVPDQIIVKFLTQDYVVPLEVSETYEPYQSL